ncbi:hypothetical protein [Alteromonas mediterranea]|uniref:Uncharacterized protein n=1 Tax=Alteromonas mediterranea (strain DSM 17117 / CIP 110805 / LMG 28347 / Deep ecotype) TaxID=1774373 RepID=F2GA64_ALTMD|nr:hypothetical protein [Alteromonas mediterranea]AEA97858.1 hypothetical protein MADE_1008590 [Alteromonas mediterranea DE]CAH1204054.1 hypothetical protein ISS312_03393 [Alteromonas mediterranea]|tara:strand:+ start:11111 stop:11323 length:213 start_codon:yes stop_codon:yes gene_type:complete
MKNQHDKSDSKKTPKGETKEESGHTNQVSESEAEAASPYASSVAGEEDPGVALEEWVKSNGPSKSKADKP